MITRLLAKIGIIEAAYLQDFDGDVIGPRMIHTNPFGQRWCYRHRLIGAKVFLNADGSTRGISYVVRWKRYGTNIKSKQINI